MTPDLVLGIDIGTSGVRIAAVDPDNALVSTAATAMPAPDRSDGHIRQDPDIWWWAVREAMGALGRAVDLARVGAVAVDGTSGTVLAIDERGRPLGPGSLYNDTCASETAKAIAAVAPPESAAHGATSALGRAIELFQRHPNAHRIVHQADWIAGRLAGRFDTSDENNALKTGYDPVTRCWPGWIAKLGFPIEKLPSVLPAGTAFAEVDDALGLPNVARVVTGTTDGCAAFLATGAEQPGDGVTSLGTTLVLKLLCDKPIFAPAYGIYSHRIGDDWLPGGASNSGGAALLKYFSPETMAALEGEIDAGTPLGLGFYPLPATGERFPINDPGLPSRTEPRPASDAAFLQALLEGIAGIEALGYRRLEELGGPALRSVRTVGGGTRNEAWRAIRARTLGVPLLEPTHFEAACGAARLARRGLAKG